ncbi:MAG: ECF transporter S component [Filifactoraceae bacterium]
MNNNKVKKLSLCALFIALTLVATLMAIPMALGYINLGDGIILTAGYLLGPYYGMLAGAIGASMADIHLGYVQYAVPTFILKGSMGLLAGIASTKKGRSAYIYYVLAGIVMISGYYLFDSLLHNNFYTPLASIPFNVLQYTVGIIICRLLAPRLKKIINL